MSHKHNSTCKDLLGNLSDYIDGELSEDLCQELQRHMAGCENCRVVYDTLTKTVYLYQVEAQEMEIPTEVRERLFSKLHLDDLLKPKA